MLERSRWRVVEEPCSPEEASARWADAASRGATGAVTSWGAGIAGRRTIRLYWEAVAGAAVPEGEDLAEENWTPFWRESLGVVRLSERLALVPAWAREAPAVRWPLRIDPGMAFGAGDHPTTRRCAGLLEELHEAGRLPVRALDVGTGTGVLALVAARLGCAAVDALDIDPFGFAACRRNARLNGLETAVRPVLRSLDLLGGTWPLLLANIVAGQLQALADLLRDRLEPGGALLLSGFTAEDEPRVRAAALPGLAVEARREEEGWVALLARCPP